jgi:hypothetical protein
MSNFGPSDFPSKFNDRGEAASAAFALWEMRGCGRHSRRDDWSDDATFFRLLCAAAVSLALTSAAAAEALM